MPLLLRILFVCLLIAAVTMQDVARAPMLLCGIGSLHHRTAEANEP